MPTITVKNIPADLYEKIKLTAARSHRSLNREIIACMEQAVRSQPVNPELLLASARELRRHTSGHPITDAEFNRAKAAGRP